MTPGNAGKLKQKRVAVDPQPLDHIAPFQSFYGRAVAMYPSDKRHDQVIQPFLWKPQKRLNSYIFVKRDICEVGKGGGGRNTFFGLSSFESKNISSTVAL